VTAFPFLPLKSTLIFSFGDAQPQIFNLMSRCKTIWSLISCGHLISAKAEEVEKIKIRHNNLNESLILFFDNIGCWLDWFSQSNNLFSFKQQASPAKPFD